MKPHVVLIGGGLMSAAAAAALARAGHPVTVLEKGELARGASGANLGQLSLFDRIEPWHYALARETFEEFSRREKPSNTTAPAAWWSSRTRPSTRGHSPSATPCAAWVSPPASWRAGRPGWWNPSWTTR